MKSSAKIAALALAAAAAAPMSSAFATEYVTNGGFEQSQYTNSLALFGPNTPAVDWSSNGQWLMFCSGTGIRCDNPATYGYLWPTVALSPQGGNFIAIDGTDGFDGILSQTINGLTTGQNLTLSFYMATAQECCANDPTSETVTATLGDQSFTTPTINTAGGGTTPWQQYSFNFTYDGAGTLLSFVNNGTGTPPYALIDGVSLQGGAAPEPGVWALMLAGFGGLGALARRRRQRAAVAA